MPVSASHNAGETITAADINALAALANANETAVAGRQLLDADLTAIAALDSATAGALATDGAGWVRKTYAQLKTALGLVKADVGLGNVDNTADASKPVSTAQAAADTAVQAAAVQRANHTGTQLAATVSDFSTAALAATTGAYAPVGSGLPQTIVSKTANYTAAAGEFVQCNTTSAGFTVTLPTAPAAGALVTVKKTSSDSNILTIVPAGGGTIDGDANATTSTKNGGAVFEHVGANVWQIAAVTLSVGATGPAGPTGATGPTGSTGPAGAMGSVSTAPVSGKFVTAPFGVTSSAYQNGDLVCSPLYLGAAVSFDRIAASITTAAGASVVRLGVYADNGSGYPGALLFDAGTVDSTTTGDKTITITQTLGPGFVWLAAVAQGGSPTGRVHSGGGAIGLSAASQANLSAGTITGYKQASVAGSLPANFTTTLTEVYFAPRVMLRAS